MKHVKTTLFLMGFLWLLPPWLMGQNNTVAVGGDASGSGGSLSYSVGQIDYSPAEGSGGTVHLGLQQPYEIFVLGTDDHPDIQITMTVYPNPTQANLTLTMDKAPSPGMYLELYDLMGRSLLKSKVLFNQTTIHMEALPNATYILRVSDDQTLFKTFKIIKK